MNKQRFNQYIVLMFDPTYGLFRTEYDTGLHSQVGVLEDDHHHAKVLGSVPEVVRLTHEVAHHVVGAKLPTSILGGCSVIFNDAHGRKQRQPEAAVQEFLYTTIQYASFGKEYHNGEGLVYLEWLQIPTEDLLLNMKYYVRKLMGT